MQHKSYDSTSLGRAISLIQDTLPTFFTTGLVESYQLTKDADPSDPTSQSDSIYSKHIQLLYTPPTRLPPFPSTIHVEGLPLYHASSVFVRHTLSMFYTNLRVELRRFQVTDVAERERKFNVRTGVLGVRRMGGAAAEWDM